MGYNDLKKMGQHITSKQQTRKPSFVGRYIERKKIERQERRQDEQIVRAQEREAYKKAYAEGRVKRATLEGRQAGMQPRMTMSRFILGPPQRQQAPRPQYRYSAPKRKKRTVRRIQPAKKQGRSSYGIDPVDNWGLL